MVKSDEQDVPANDNDTWLYHAHHNGPADSSSPRVRRKSVAASSFASNSNKHAKAWREEWLKICNEHQETKVEIKERVRKEDELRERGANGEDNDSLLVTTAPQKVRSPPIIRPSLTGACVGVSAFHTFHGLWRTT